MIKEKWASVHIPTLFTGGMNTMARAEAMNCMLKRSMVTRYTLVNLLMEVLKVEQNIIRLSREVITASWLETNINHPMLHEL